MFCPACAAPTPASASNCPQCGRALARAGRSDSPPDPNEPAPDAGSSQARGVRRLRLALLALIPLVAGIGVVAWLVAVRAADRDAAWSRAQSALAVGEYDSALAALSPIANRPEAARLQAALAATLPAAEDAYRRAVDQLATGDDVAAIAALQSVLRRLPDFPHAATLQSQARATEARRLRDALTEAETGRDWAAAERDAASLLALDPGNRALAAQRAAIERDHAPIVVAQNQKLWLIDPATGDERLLFDRVPATRPIWSPDRTRVAFIAGQLARPDNPAALYVVNADGSGARALAHNVHPNAIAAWSPDGRQIAFTSVAGWNLDAEQGIMAIHVVDVATGAERDLTTFTGRHAVTPTWSPDGRFLAFVARDVSDAPGSRGLADAGDVDTIDLATGAIANLTQGRLPGVIRVLWSPVAPQLLAYGRGQPIGTSAADADATTSLSLIDVSTGAIVTLEPTIATTAPGWAPAWSPDGAAIAYVDDDGAVVVLRNGQRERIATGQDLLGEISWSPDGSRLLAPAGNSFEPSVIVDPADPGAVPTSLPIAFDTTWPTGTPQWSPLQAAPPAPGGFGAALDR